MESNTTVETCLYYCNTTAATSQNDTVSSKQPINFCPPVCLRICPSTCHHTLSSTPNLPLSPQNTHHHLSPFFLSLIIILPSVLLLITVYAIWFKFRKNSGRIGASDSLDTVGKSISAVGLDLASKMEERGCGVCLVDFRGVDDLSRVLIECGHVFHADCIATWVKSDVTCPLCRRSMKSVEKHAGSEITVDMGMENKPDSDS